MSELFPYTRNTEASPPPATQSDALFDSRDGLFDWVELAGAQIRRSAWSEALRIDEVDAWEAASTALAIGLLGLSRRVRNGGRPSARPRIVRAIHQFAANTYRATLGGPWPFVRRLDPRAELLFWPVEPTHVAAQAPVIRAARSFGSMVEIVVCRRKAESLIDAAGVGPATFLPSQYRAAYRRGLRVGGRRARALWSDPGVKFPELEPGVTREDLITCLRRALQPAVEVVNWVVAVHHELARDCPHAVFVVGNDLTLEGRTLALCQSARSRPSASLMHGVLGSRRQHARHIVDRFLVYGEVQRQALVAAGLSENKIAICGAPLMEAQRGRTRTNRHPSVRKLGLVDDRPFVLLATSGPGNSISLEHHLDVIRAVAQLSVIMPEVQFVARKHRKDRRHLYTTICDSIPGNRLVVPLDDVISATSIFDWLQACQMVITGGSAVAVDAMFAGVPVVTLDLRNELEGVDFIRAGATRHVRSRAELERVVRDTLRSPAKPELDRHVREFLQLNYSFPEEGAATRCARTLRELGTAHGGVPLPRDEV